VWALSSRTKGNFHNIFQQFHSIEMNNGYLDNFCSQLVRIFRHCSIFVFLRTLLKTSTNQHYNRLSQQFFRGVGYVEMRQKIQYKNSKCSAEMLFYSFLSVWNFRIANSYLLLLFYISFYFLYYYLLLLLLLLYGSILYSHWFTKIQSCLSPKIQLSANVIY
jgi:hypothetical protein